jgi:citrate lyase beta subunit
VPNLRLPMSFILTLWTNDPERAAYADRAGVDRIGVDLERSGKDQRQVGPRHWISPHRFEDLLRIRPGVSNADLFVRTNGIHDGSAEEIERLIVAGVSTLMLPNFTRREELAEYTSLIAGRAKVVPLVEREAAVDLIPEMRPLGISEFHVGLNDLSLDLAVPHRMGVLLHPVIERIRSGAREAGLRWGLAALGRAHDNDLPIPSDLVYAQHARLGSSGALLARSFFPAVMDESTLVTEIRKLRERMEEWYRASPDEIRKAHEALIAVLERPTAREAV